MSLAVVCLVGPTGAGKTAAALHLARCLRGEVVNFDSRQVYRDIPVITAQPDAQEQALCPHHLYGYLASDIPVQAGRFVETVRNTLEEITARGSLPLLVGGTGLYLQTLIQGIAPIPAIAPKVREGILTECATKGSPALYERLKEADPWYAAKIHPNDKQRICRALEVLEDTGKPLSWWHTQPGEQFGRIQALKLGMRMELATCKPRLARRIDAMLLCGAVQEMEDAYAVCPDRNAPAFTGIGCPELLGHILDNVGMDQTKQAWLQHTRAYAKRQITWFKRDTAIYWFAPDDVQGMEDAVRAWLEGRGGQPGMLGGKPPGQGTLPCALERGLFL